MSHAISEADRLIIKQAIHDAEMRTSGEIRLCIENACPLDVLDRSAFIFKKLLMHKTKDRNGILIYLSLSDRKYAIIGDAGIHKHVHQDFWDRLGLEMTGYFQKGSLAEGIVYAIHQTGEKLATYFPYHREDKNELSNDIYFGDGKK